jgi:glycine cleavage system H protein
MNSVQEGYFYLKTHEWVKPVDETTFLVGISDYAQHALGDIVYVALPEIGDKVQFNERFCDVESVKAVSDVYSPLNGKIVEVNGTLEDSPELLNQDPYATWIMKVEGSFDISGLLNAQDYTKFLEDQH